jgi:hypothetical protein
MFARENLDFTTLLGTSLRLGWQGRERHQLCRINFYGQNTPFDLLVVGFLWVYYLLPCP